MDRYFLTFLLTLVFHHSASGTSPETIRPKERDPVQIECRAESGSSLVTWFRVLENSKMEFIGSFSGTGIPKTKLMSTFSHAGGNTITLKSFKASRDIGLYSCGSLKSNALIFGKVTSLIGEKVVSKPPSVTTKMIAPKMTMKAPECTCPTPPMQVEPRSQVFCEPIILGALAGGCGLLLLLLVVTALYCNRIRTRRCPHHYRKRPQTKPPGNK